MFYNIIAATAVMVKATLLPYCFLSFSSSSSSFNSISLSNHFQSTEFMQLELQPRDLSSMLSCAAFKSLKGAEKNPPRKACILSLQLPSLACLIIMPTLGIVIHQSSIVTIAEKLPQQYQCQYHYLLNMSLNLVF